MHNPDKFTSRFVIERTILYHGTSTRFLRSILKQGLVYSPKNPESPEAKKGGIYLSNKLTVAMEAATTAVCKYDGTPLLVCCLLNIRNYNADTDAESYSNLYTVLGSNPTVGQLLHVYRLGLIDRGLLSGELTNAEYAEYEKHLASYVTGIPPLKINKPELADDLFFAVLSTQVAKVSPELYSSLLQCEQPTSDSSEREFLRAFDTYNRYISFNTLNDKNRPTLNTKVPNLIGYSGRNRILSVGEILNDPVDRVIVHYGKLPIQFIKENQERVGKRFKIERLDSSFPIYQARAAVA